MTPVEVGTNLLKAHNLPLDTASDIQQISPGEIWRGLALDLLLGNIAEPIWGWADPQAVYLLDFWKKVEPGVRFILVYASPALACTTTFKKKPIAAEELRQTADLWQSFNATLLHFFNRNTERCLLVHADRVKMDTAAFVADVSALVDFPLRQSTTEREDPISSNHLQLFLAETMVRECPDVLGLYEELQSVATHPLTSDGQQAEELPGDLPEAPIKAWNVLGELETKLTIQDQTVAELQQENKGLVDEHVGQLEDLTRTNQAATDELRQENELLLLQLHQVQEELERYYLENQQFKRQSDNRERPLHGAADRIKRQLSYRLGAKMIERSRSFRGWLGMPWALRKQVREFRREKKEQGDRNFPPISSYLDAHEAERCKQHLSYRLGAVMIANARTPVGWLKMPWVLRREVRDFRRTKNVNS